MVRRFFALVVVLAISLLGFPLLAEAALLEPQGTSQTHDMQDCVCPPGHEMPPQDGADPCAPTLACMVQCGMVPLAAPVIGATAPASAPATQAVPPDLIAPSTPAVAPPFRPPAR